MGDRTKSQWPEEGQLRKGLWRMWSRMSAVTFAGVWTAQIYDLAGMQHTGYSAGPWSLD